MRQLMVFAGLIMMVGTVEVAAQEAQSSSEHSDYGVLFGVSPFGGSATFSRHVSTRTTWQFSLGGTPHTVLDVPVGDIDYSMGTESTWLGCFINHRPLEKATWFRLVAGFAIGNIEHRLEDADGNVILAEYRESPVTYVGVGIGTSTERGITYGFDLGWLQSAGPRFSYLEGALSVDEQSERIKALSEDFFFGSFLPNVQLGLGYNF